MNILEHFEKTSPVSYRAFVPTKSGKLMMSVIAGPYTFCSPKQFFENVEKYKSLEVGLFNKETGHWASYNEVKSVIELFDGEREYDETEQPDVPQTVVFSYVPIADINKAWEIL